MQKAFCGRAYTPWSSKLLDVPGLLGIRKSRRCVVCGKGTFGRYEGKPVCPNHSNAEVELAAMSRPRRPGDGKVKIIRPANRKSR